MPRVETGPALPGLRIVGVLGGIGSGKSTAAQALAQALRPTAGSARREALVLDADATVADLLEEPVTVQRIARELGVEVLGPDRRIDRKALAEMVFRSPDRRRLLERILHPGVRRAFHGRLQEVERRQVPAWVVLDVPLLLETGLEALCDFLVFVRAGAAARARRALARHGWNSAQWAQREATQLPTAQKEAVAHAILDNDGSVEHLQEQARALRSRLLQLPPRPLRERWPRWDEAPARRPG